MFATLLLVSTLGSAAAADDRSAAEFGASKTQMQMYVTGFDADVAEANGYTIVTLDSGYQASVPADQAGNVRTIEDVIVAGGDIEYAATVDAGLSVTSTSGGGASPNGMVYGDCGRAWVYMYRQSATQYEMVTGFLLSGSRRAIQYTWNVAVFGPGYFHNHFDSGALRNRQSWWDSDIKSVIFGGQYTAYMYGGMLNYAILNNGAICTALYSSDSVNI